MGAVYAGTSEMTPSQGWQLLMAVNWELSCGFWPYSLLDVLFTGLEILVSMWKLGSEKVSPRVSFLRRKKKLQMYLKPGLGSPRMSLLLSSIS